MPCAFAQPFTLQMNSSGLSAHEVEVTPTLCHPYSSKTFDGTRGFPGEGPPRRTPPDSWGIAVGGKHKRATAGESVTCRRVTAASCTLAAVCSGPPDG